MANAIIQAQLHMNPEDLSDDEWGVQLRKAIYIENRHIYQLSKLFRTK